MAAPGSRKSSRRRRHRKRSKTTSPRADGPLAELALFLDEAATGRGEPESAGRPRAGRPPQKLDRGLLDDLDTPERLRELLDQVGPMLMSRLNGKGAST